MKTVNSQHEYREVLCARCGSSLRFPISCRNRFCNVCSMTKRLRLRDRLDYLVRHSQRENALFFKKKQKTSFLSFQKKNKKINLSLKHIVLTIPNQSCLSDAVKSLVSSFRKLRSRELWKRHVAGGVFVIEVTGSPGKWHAHVHIIAHARYFPVFLLSKAWQSCSIGRVVWITEVAKKAVVNYLCKYLTKSEVPDEFHQQISDVLRNYRLFQPFGSWFGASKGYERPPYPCPACASSDWYMPEAHSHASRLHIQAPVSARSP